MPALAERRSFRDERTRELLYINSCVQRIPYTLDALYALLESLYEPQEFDVRYIDNGSSVELYVPSKDVTMWIGTRGKNVSILKRFYFQCQSVRVYPYGRR